MENQIRVNATQILEENAKNAGMCLQSYFAQSVEHDPRFFNWLFPNAENIGEFGIGMTEEQLEAFDIFAEGINSLMRIREEFEL